ncbi:hypothetical protein AX15_007493 [Amanita polypyramis BW_CC]|nr:hypothetical protein AX15_007493 [Amanita polypyramis BW_CC]
MYQETPTARPSASANGNLSPSQLPGSPPPNHGADFPQQPPLLPQKRFRPLPPIPGTQPHGSPAQVLLHTTSAMEPPLPGSSVMLHPLTISRSITGLLTDPGEITARQNDYVNQLPVGALAPSIPGQPSVDHFTPSSRENNVAVGMQYSQGFMHRETAYPFYTPVVNSPLYSQSPRTSTPGSPKIASLDLRSPESLSSSSSSHFNHYSHASPLPAPQIMSPSQDSILFEPNADNAQRLVDNYGRILQFVGEFPLQGVQEDDLSDRSSLEEDDPMRFVNWALLSHNAVRLRDKVPRGVHVKGSIPYPRAFTGKDIVSTIHFQIQRELVMHLGGTAEDRRAALHVARSLESQLFFYEVEWGSRALQDGVENVYMFLDDQEGDDSPMERGELPTGVATYLTRCYSPDCGGGTCYSYSCPRKSSSLLQLLPDPVESSAGPSTETWSDKVPREVINSLPEREIKRQTIIHTLITLEEQYIKDLDTVESVFIKPLQRANPPIISPLDLEEFLDEVFHNILDLRECNRRLLEVLYVRQREQGPVIERVGDVFLDAATEFRIVYPTYVGHHPIAEKRVKEELERNSEFRLFIERSSLHRVPSQMEGTRLLDLKHYLNRPSEHLQKYPVLLEAIVNETHRTNPDGEFLQEAIDAIKSLQQVAQIRTFQSAMCKGFTAKWEWNDLVSREMIKGMSKEEIKRQSVIFELIKGEMAFVRDLELIETLFVQPLRNAEPAIIPPEKLDQVLRDIFCNFAELHAHHRSLLNKLHDIQREEHPRIRSITAPLFDAALNFREAYMEYIPNYPIAEYRIDDEKARNSLFKHFHDQCLRHPDARRLDMKSFINRPIPRLLRYELLLRNIQEDTPPMHDDRDAIPQVIEVIKALGKDTEPGVQSARLKVEVWHYNSNFIFKPGEYTDMDLLNEQRSLVHSGKLLRQPEGGLTTWTEVFVLLFDNYLVLTKPREKDGVTRYHVIKRPIPLELLALYNFQDPRLIRGTGILRGLRNTGTPTDIQTQDGLDPRGIYPMTVLQTGRSGGILNLYAESSAAREEWKVKLDEALGLRNVVQESNRVFEIETLNINTFYVHSSSAATLYQTQWQDGHSATGKVTCSVPFNTVDGRGLIAVGCPEGLWMGFRHDSRSMQRVLHIKKVTQCEMLDGFGVFLVLADNVLFAYHIEALVPSNPSMAQSLQKMNTIVHKDVQFFRAGRLNGRTLIVSVKKDGSNSIFHVMEPVFDKINEKNKAPSGITSRILGSKLNWFRDYRRFIHSCEAYDVVFLKAKLAILSSRGFEILDATNFQSTVNIPLREDPNTTFIAKRCDTCRPIGIFRSTDSEFLLCYNDFGVYVNKRGFLSRPSTGTVEWEGKAESVAIHPPYILLFDYQFIEVRHIRTGRLAQIIRGSRIRNLWNGLGPQMDAIIVPSDGDEQLVQEPRVHAVMDVDESMITHPNGRPGKPAPQHVFELMPTIPLYLPGSLASPSTRTYFPQSYSPPRSPPLRANHRFVP